MHCSKLTRTIALIGIFAAALALPAPAAQAADPTATAGLPAATRASNNSDPVGVLDSATLTPAGLVLMSGWAADADSPTKPVRVEFRDNGVYNKATIAGSDRYDVAAAYPALGPAHGFGFTISVPDGSHQLCAIANDLGTGADTSLGCFTLDVHNNPTGSMGKATVVNNTATITGSAVDPNSALPVLVRAYVDGTYRTGVQANRAHNGYAVALQLTEGTHSVCLYALNIGAGTTTKQGCQSVLIHNNPFGTVDSVTQAPGGLRVSGYAIDLNTSASIIVRLYVDGHYVDGALASAARPDVEAAFPNSGAAHGYTILRPVAQGSHAVCVYAINVGAGTNTKLGCSVFAIRNNPFGAVESAVQVPGGILITGYAVDLNTTSPIGIQVNADGRFGLRGTAAIARPDLLQHFPTSGTKHGFAVLARFNGGTHTVCTYALNVGAGVNGALGCRKIVMQDDPVAAVGGAVHSPTGVTIGGFALDPDVAAPIYVRAYVDGTYATTVLADQAAPALAASHPGQGIAHGFALTVGLTPGAHSVCLYALNAGAGSTVRFTCIAVVRTVNPTGAATTIARVGTGNAIAVAGWALDPDSLAPISVHVIVDGVDRFSLPANTANAASAAHYAFYGTGHGFTGQFTLDGLEHQVCVFAYNVGTGRNAGLKCVRLYSAGTTVPARPVSFTGVGGSHAVSLAWVAPRSDAGPITKYEVTVSPGGRVKTVSGATLATVIGGLSNGTLYTFSLRAGNKLGRGSATVTQSVPTNIPPQVTPAPISTSHYIRNITSNTANNAAMLRAMGAADAARNPSGHSYLILLQIGGQDEADQGVLLSAIARYVSYPVVVSSMKAYLDGYRSTQKPYAPLTLAVGTNSDVDVNASAGRSWARNIINPILAYAATHNPGTVIAGANDMEPGFSATAGESRAWLSGYLAATSAEYVFNGSADGCSTGGSGSRCNNGWTMADLQWLSGGAAPSRTISLPQIYNHAMPLQWKYISLTGVNLGRPRVYFGGPLTEVTACSQAGGSCGSIGNTLAWNLLWDAISSTAATRQAQMPHGTDLRIN